MAETRSLGVHTPVALPHLISEGILPEDPKRDLYQWDTYVVQSEHGEVEEEVLVTKQCVVWSRGQFVRNVYRFEVDAEDVVQAILTNFTTTESPPSTTSTKGKHLRNGDNSHDSLKPTSNFIPIHSGQRFPKSTVSQSGDSSRALVVFLKTKAHVYFLSGSEHIVNLPFEIERAFPAPCGVIVQRKPPQMPSLPQTPKLPAAPPNSFLSTQMQLNASYSQSPMLAKSFGGTQPPRPSPLSASKGLDGQLLDIFGSYDPGLDENLAPLYSLTDPLSEFGVVTYSIQHPKPRLAGKNQPGVDVEFEALDSAEEVVYVSPEDELAHNHSQRHAMLMLIVTVNNELRTLTVWHAWYINETSLSLLIKQRTEQKAAKARRRSSFLSTGLGTGSATPAVRHREGTRESFAAGGSMRLPSDVVASHQTAASSRKPTRQEEEEAMASQMDPDYQPTASQQNARDSRRISSLNTDVRASQTVAHPSFGGTTGRRNTSFGGATERRSFGPRKSRGSTPGSVFSRSVGPQDDEMDVDGSMDADGEETVDSILRHIRATYEAAGADSIFGGNDGDFRRDIVVRKLHSIPLSSSASSSRDDATKFRVVTLRDPLPLRDTDGQRVNIYIRDSATKVLSCLQLKITHRLSFSTNETPQQIAVPIFAAETNLGQCTDITKLKQDDVEVVLVADRGLILSLDDGTTWSLSNDAPYRMYNALGTRSGRKRADKEIGMNRTIQGPSLGSYSLKHSGIRGSFDQVASDGVCHRRQLKLKPFDRWVDQLLTVCQLLVPIRQANLVSGMWYGAHAWLVAHPEASRSTAVEIEWLAFATTVFAFFFHSISERARAALNVWRVAVNEGASKKSELLLQQQETLLQRETPWGLLMNGLESAKPLKDDFLMISIELADQFTQAGGHWNSFADSIALSSAHAMRLMLAFHIFHEEQKLSTLKRNSPRTHALSAIIVQLGSLFGVPAWGCSSDQHYGLEGVSEDKWTLLKSSMPRVRPLVPLMEEPVGIFQWFEHSLKTNSLERYPTLDIVAAMESPASLSEDFVQEAKSLTPRIAALSNVLQESSGLSTDAVSTVELMAKHGITAETMESLPRAIAAPFREAIARCQKEPPTTWSTHMLKLVGRNDLIFETMGRRSSPLKSQTPVRSAPRDIQTICNELDQHPYSLKTKEAGRHAVSQLIFSEDRRLVEATSLMHFNTSQVAECPKQPDWSDAQHLEQQRRIMQWATIRMIALPAGDAMIHYDSQTPLLTDKYHLPGFSNSCLIQPMGHTLTTDRSGLTEEKVNWAYFHAGVSVGLRISRNIMGIDTSWIAFNKPNELTNRHAGLLLALGLGGHLRHLAKWLSFKYLTPKHTMTSVGLLLGLSASYMGTMDQLITRMLSVHITRMLPHGAAELNLSQVTQTAGLMGIGLLYYNTQHRRMSEIMLSEVEHMELEDPDSGPDPLRDESYRLAAGFALGFINLGMGKDLRGLHGMSLAERLLAIAVGPRPVNAVHVFDQATAGAVIAIALVYMKSGDRSIAQKIDIPDSEAQFDHVRPDVLMLRAMAKHVILWDDIETREGPRHIPTWIYANIPMCYASRFQEIVAANGRHPLRSSDIPFFNIATGLAWVLSLKYAGSGNSHARDEILIVLDIFYLVQGAASTSSSTRFLNYDAKLAKSTVRRCIDVLALSAATVMAGTGDLKTFRYLRPLHGRTDPETPYGSHFAAHLAIGVLFLGGGTYTFGTSDLAIAALICAFYPLYPTDVHDNHVHLQAFRHLWVFAAEARCLIIEDIDTQRPISMPINLTLTDGSTKSLTSPCLIPELQNIATIQTDDPAYWRVTLDFANNEKHLSAFKSSQRILARRCPASEAHNSVFTASLAALNDAEQGRLATRTPQIWQSIFNLPALKDFDKADLELILPPDEHSSVYTDELGTVVDDRLELSKDIDGMDTNQLWNLRLLFAWAEKARDGDEGRLKWIGHAVVEALKALVEERKRESASSD